MSKKLAINLTTANEFHALWEALNQYIDNAEDEDTRSSSDSAKIEAAETMRDRLDAAHAGVSRHT